MTTVDIRQAKTQLSRLLARAARGESVVIAKAGEPIARVLPVNATKTPVNRLGFMRGEVLVPADFDRMGREDIRSMFGGRKRGKLA
jgi:prevent-host-death family protein